MLSLPLQRHTLVNMLLGDPLPRKAVHPSFPRDNHHLLVCLVLRPEKCGLAFCLPGVTQVARSCLWGRPDMARNVGCTPFVASVLQTVASSQGDCPSLPFF